MMKTRKKILIADDSVINRFMLTDMLSKQYDILEAVDGVQAVAMINQYQLELSLVLLDIVMPKMDGFGVLAAMNTNKWIEKIPVIIISASTSSEHIDKAYSLGATEYINRPFDPKTVQRRVANTVMLYSRQNMLESMVTEQMLEKEKHSLLMVEVLSHIVEFRNGESGMHVLNIRTVTKILLNQLIRKTDKYSISYPDISLIANAATLHDIGKISISDEILNKPGKLTPEEYEIIKKHSMIGARMLEETSYYHGEELVITASKICRWHHERYDGKGYPDGLKGDEIPIEAQVVALADVYDALINKRVYKPAYSHEQALNMILNGECGEFNPLLLECMTEVGPKLRTELSSHFSNNGVTTDLDDASWNVLQSSGVLSNTMTLLEQERIKHRFFTLTAREIQFEYDLKTDILTISDWGASRLGINPIVQHLPENSVVHTIISDDDYDALSNKIRAATSDNPMVTHICCLNIGGKLYWHKILARPLWIDDETDKMIGIIGKCVDIYNEPAESVHSLTYK